MNEFQEMGKRNASIRGYIIRELVRGYNGALLVRRIANDLQRDGLINTLDEVAAPLQYLYDMELVKFKRHGVTAYSALSEDAVVGLTRKGIRFVEAGGDDDSGIDL